MTDEKAIKVTEWIAIKMPVETDDETMGYISSKAIDMTCNDGVIRSNADAMREIVREHRAFKHYIEGSTGISVWVCPMGHINSSQNENCDKCDDQSWGRTL